jgi:DNA repair protein RadA/Sms
MNCTNCSAKLRAGTFKCPKCKKWNFQTKNALEGRKDVQILSEVEDNEVDHISTGAWDPCFGIHFRTKKAGPVKGSVYLLGGVPGAGKSTLSLQLADALGGSLQQNVMYIAAEEELKPIKERGLRLQLQHMNKILGISAVGGIQTELGRLLLEYKPAGIVLDSLPGLSLDTAAAGVEYCQALKGYAVALKCPIIVIDHATKQDDLAGLMALQHGVDGTLVMFVNEDETRTLTNIKCRHGPSGIEIHMAMTEFGLRKIESSDSDSDTEEDDEEEDNRRGAS